MIKYFTIEDLLKHYLQKKFHILSKIKTGKVSAIRFSTLNAICDALDCQPGDILEFQKDTQED